MLQCTNPAAQAGGLPAPLEMVVTRMLGSKSALALLQKPSSFPPSFQTRVFLEIHFEGAPEPSLGIKKEAQVRDLLCQLNEARKVAEKMEKELRQETVKYRPEGALFALINLN